MSYQNQDNELRTRFKTIWNNRTPVEWPNIAIGLLEPPAPWCRFTVTESDGEQLTFGASLNNFRYPGVIIIQIFVPSNTGDGLALQRADEAAAIFHNWGGTNIQCRAASVKNIGNDGNGYYQVNVRIPFYRTELK